MASRKVEHRIESLGNRIDNLAVRMFGDEEIGLNPRMEERDARILKYFPMFVALSLLVWLASMVVQDDFSLGKLIQLLCFVFCAMFSLLGIPCFITMDNGPFPRSVMLLMGLIGSAIIWIFMASTGQTLFDQAVEGVLAFFGLEVEGTLLHFLSFVVIFCILTFTTCSVLTVVCAYLRNYVVNVLASIHSRAGTGVRGKAEKFFSVPDIIDIDSVELEPRINHNRFDIDCFLSLAVYMVIMGFMISSYVFVNPYFLDAVDWKVSLSIMILLSSFMPCLIIPWQFFKTIGAKVCSKGNRDYYLWNGAKSKLFTSFLALSSFSMMFLLSLYFGNDILAILSNYAFYLIPLIIITVMYAGMFSNNFNKNLVRSVYVSFYIRKEHTPRGSAPKLLPCEDDDDE